MFAEHMSIDIAELVSTFFRERMVEWAPGRGLPSTYAEFREDLRAYAEQVSMRIQPNQLDDALVAMSIGECNKKMPVGSKPPTRRVCAAVVKDGPRTIPVKIWTMVPPGSSILHQLHAGSM